MHAEEQAKKQPRGKMKFMQRYYHKGAFFQDEWDVLNRDFTQATGEDLADKELLPTIMQVCITLFSLSYVPLVMSCYHSLLF